MRCVERTLTYMRTFKKDVLNYVQKPFPSVESVTLQGQFEKFASDSLRLNELFPIMRSLMMGEALVTQKNSLVLEYPNLQHLDVGIWHKDFKEETIQELIEVNPQIRSISIFNQAQVGEHILFPNLLRLSVKSYNNYLPEVVVVEKLQHLKIEFYSKSSNEWLNFIRRHTNIKRIHFGGERLENNDLVRLIGNVPNLIELSLFIATDVDVDMVVELLKQSPRLKTVKCIQIMFSSEKLNEITSGTKDEWTITKASYNYVFTRKEGRHYSLFTSL